MQERVVRQIRMLRAMRRGLETDYGDFYTGTQGETPDTAKRRDRILAPFTIRSGCAAKENAAAICGSVEAPVR